MSRVSAARLPPTAISRERRALPAPMPTPTGAGWRPRSGDAWRETGSAPAWPHRTGGEFGEWRGGCLLPLFQQQLDEMGDRHSDRPACARVPPKSVYPRSEFVSFLDATRLALRAVSPDLEGGRLCDREARAVSRPSFPDSGRIAYSGQHLGYRPWGSLGGWGGRSSRSSGRRACPAGWPRDRG